MKKSLKIKYIISYLAGVIFCCSVNAQVANVNLCKANNSKMKKTSKTAEFISVFGSSSTKKNSIIIQGEITKVETSKNIVVQEDNLLTFTATPLVFDNSIKKITASAIIGDGPHGSAGSGKGDIDIYMVTLKPEQSITFKATAAPNSNVNLSSIMFTKETIYDRDFSNTPSTTLNYFTPIRETIYFAVLDYKSTGKILNLDNRLLFF